MRHKHHFDLLEIEEDLDLGMRFVHDFAVVVEEGEHRKGLIELLHIQE